LLLIAPSERGPDGSRVQDGGRALGDRGRDPARQRVDGVGDLLDDDRDREPPLVVEEVVGIVMRTPARSVIFASSWRSDAEDI
jgi:hypothetical protein